MKPESKNEYYESTINLSEIISVLWKDKILITLITVLVSIASVFYSLSIPNNYQSSAILQITGGNESNSLSGLSDQYSSLASLAGISLPSATNDKSDYVINTLKSREFLRHILSFPKIRENLMAIESYNRETEALSYNNVVFNNGKWVIKTPSYLEIHKKVYSKNFKVVKVIDSGFVKISFMHQSPYFAKDFLDLLINEINNITKKKDLKESEIALNYLENQINVNSQKEIRSSINQLITSQLNSKMLANVKDDYIIRSIDPPFVPEYKHSPDRQLICIFGFLLGFFIATMLSLFRNYY